MSLNYNKNIYKKNMAKMKKKEEIWNAVSIHQRKNDPSFRVKIHPIEDVVVDVQQLEQKLVGRTIISDVVTKKMKASEVVGTGKVSDYKLENLLAIGVDPSMLKECHLNGQRIDVADTINLPDIQIPQPQPESQPVDIPQAEAEVEK